MTTTRFCFGPFRAEDVNLSGSDFVAGIPAPSAALGFVGAIARKLGTTGWDHRAILVIHDLQVTPGRTKGERSIVAGKSVPIEIAESLVGSGSFTIIGELPGEHDLGDIIDCIMMMRFGGGSIFAPSGHSIPQLVRPIDDQDIATVILRLPRGMALSPPVGRDNAQAVSFGEILSLEAWRGRRSARENSQAAAGSFPPPRSVTAC